MGKREVAGKGNGARRKTKLRRLEEELGRAGFRHG